MRCFHVVARQRVEGSCDEIKSGDWAIGGQALRTSDVKALAAGTGSADPKAA